MRLFGSRLRDELQGGDIDLLVECVQPVARPIWLAAQIAAHLRRALGDQSIDVLLTEPGTVDEPLHRVARAGGVLLKS